MSENQKTEDKALDPEAQTQSGHAAKTEDSRLERFKAWYTERKKWTIPASVLLFILILAAIPFTRYGIAGLAIKHDVTVKVVDATADTPVSGATLTAGSVSVQTDSAGNATLRHLKAGHHKVVLSKKYYKDETVDVLSPLFGHSTAPSVRLTATGRQVKIVVTNLINKHALADVDIKVAGTTAKTDQDGSALVVLPVGTADQTAQLSADGFNDAQVTVKVSNGKIQENDFNMTPAGKVYFLSKLSGKIDVVKTNLDGTDRQTVLAGTGNEDDRNTVLLASRDWKYLALLSRRAGPSPTIYLIDTSNDSSSVIESGSSSFQLVGWAGDKFIYKVVSSDVQPWQAGHESIKSFDAPSKKVSVLDQTQVDDVQSNYWYESESYGPIYAYDDQVIYIKNWTYGLAFSPASSSAKQSTLNSVKADGTNKKAIRSFAAQDPSLVQSAFLDAVALKPDSIELRFYDGNSDNFYNYGNGQVKSDPSMTTATFYNSTNTYLLSPSGNNTFWSEPRDGKNTLFIGDEEGENGKQIATLSDYSPYGWYTDNYLLMSKNASELYITDNSTKQTLVKISDYHKPAVSFQGYGGGYGGL
jgi:hypothetical protein